MCGITGYISLNKDILSEKEFAHFNDSLNHRGPDWRQQLLTKRGWIGHTKLSITDTSKSSNQPFNYKTEEGILYRMVFNGEIYNQADQRATQSLDYILDSIRHRSSDRAQNGRKVPIQVQWNMGHRHCNESNGEFFYPETDLA